MNRLATYLNRHLEGVVYSAPGILSSYSMDRSVLKYYPRLVVQPANSTDLRRITKFSYQLSAKNISFPITVRGAGLDKMGGDLGTGLIADITKMNNIQEIDSLQRLVRVQTGVRLGVLRQALALQGLDFPIVGDDDETINDLISRNAPAYYNAKESSIREFINRIEVVLADGNMVEFAPVSRYTAKRLAKQDSLEGDIYKQLLAMQQNDKELIKTYHPKHNRMGYSGIREAVKDKINPADLFCGADNTLGLISEVILRVEAEYECPQRFGIVCRNSHEYVKATTLLKKIGFTDLYVHDTELFNELPNTGKTSSFFRNASDDGYFIIATVKDDSNMVRKYKIHKLKSELKLRIIEETPQNAADFDALEKNLDAYLNDFSASNLHLPILDGIYVPAEKQVKFLNGIIKLSDKFECKLAVFGLPDFNSFNLRPSFSISDSEGRKRLIRFIREYLELVKSCDGNPCAITTEGRFMSLFVNRDRDVKQIELESRIKKIFDPAGILNPGVKHECDPTNTLRHFRTEYGQEIQSTK